MGTLDLKEAVKKLLKKKPRHRLSVFEQAVEKSTLNIEVKKADYQYESMFVKRFSGIVKQGRKQIYVHWDGGGKAWVLDLRDPSFDLELS